MFYSILDIHDRHLQWFYYCVVETGHALSLRKTDLDEAKEKQKHPRYENQGKNTISSMVGSFKSAVTK